MNAIPSKKVDVVGKTELYGDLDVGLAIAKQNQPTIKFYRLPLMVAVFCELSFGAKLLYAALNWMANGSNVCQTSVEKLADRLGTWPATIRKWRSELERFGLIKVGNGWPSKRCYLKPLFRRGGFIPILNTIAEQRGKSPGEKLLLSLIAYRQRDNDWCWGKQEDLAAELGMSLRTVQLIQDRLSKAKQIQCLSNAVNRNRGKRCRIEYQWGLGNRIFGSKTHAQIAPPIDKTLKVRSSFIEKPAKFKFGDLSARGSEDGFGPEAVFLELVNVGIHEKVARPMAFEQNHPPESVAQAINNAQILRAQKWKPAEEARQPRPKFSVPGYVVNALNGARREGKIVGTTKLFRSAAAMSRAIKIAKARRGRRPPLSDTEIADRVRKWKRALGLPA